jgi:hypothetical protein
MLATLKYASSQDQLTPCKPTSIERSRPVAHNQRAQPQQAPQREHPHLEHKRNNASTDERGSELQELKSNIE